MERFYATLFLVLIGLGAAFLSLEYGIGTATAPQAGYFPLLLSILLTGLSTIAAIREYAGRHGPGLGAWPLRQLVFIMVALVVFAVLIGGGTAIGLPGAGLLPATFFLVLIASRAASMIHPKESLVLAVILATVSWAIFKELLGLPVPLWPWSY
ncbi:hypothetical protein ACO34A_22925 (plasmid) [Rhizobium sp. ACO-34A]|nr:tripartite tricarboxylate transporter TctB family protein [Rhizobium sp. ACO-34A]ATN36645.1 hypothetical protein ACO34A_22925 [Rhizobium sp. ACO-34A]